MSDVESISSMSSRASSKPQPPMDLTPRSKVRAMLAALDDSEEDAPALKPSAMNTMESARAAQLSTNNSEEDEPVRKAAPKGRVAAGMQADVEESEESGDNSDSAVGPTLHIRRRFLATNEHLNSDKNSSNSPPTQDSTGDEDDVFTRAVRRRKASSAPRSPQHRKTPSPGPTSPGLFLTPDKSPSSRRQAIDNGSDSEEPSLPKLNPLQALVARKRAERLAKEKEIEEQYSEEEEVSKPQKPPAKKTRRIMAESESDEDKEAGAKLTQQARPTRKASKKAMEEMNRETQRLSRNMQLTYVAKTKTKVTLDDFLSTFNKHGPSTAALTSIAEVNSSSSIHGDDETSAVVGTPPSSPPSIGHSTVEGAATRDFRIPTHLYTLEDHQDDDEELPSLEEALTQRYVEPKLVAGVSNQAFSKALSLRRFEKSKKPSGTTASDSDDDLEIIKPGPLSRLAIFDQIPESKARESSSIHALRALAHLNGSSGRKGKSSMTPGQLHTLLHQRAREQADRERNEKIQALRDKGVLVQSAEEKERDQLQLENMLEKARQEAKELGDKEKAAAKKDGKDGNDENQLPDDDDEDGDWGGSEEEDAGVALSGSEDEQIPDGSDEAESSGDEEEDAAVDEATSSLIDNEAGEDEDDEEVEADCESDEEDLSVLQDEESNQTPLVVPSRPRLRKMVVVSDDEDDEVIVNRTPQRRMLNTPKSAVAAAFGFARTTPVPLGLSQMFAGTMADSQAGPMPTYDSQQNSLNFLKSLPEPDLFGFITPNDNSQGLLVQDSQSEDPFNLESQIGGMVQFDSQSQMPYGESQISEFPDLTQDVGFQPVPTLPANYQPPASYSTVTTIPLGSIENTQSPVVKKKRRLIRGNDARPNPRLELGPISPTQVNIDDEAEDLDGDEADNFNDAFAIMRKANAKSVEAEYNKKKSTAKGMVEEQAEESEDEYAGLGGASDDDGSEGELDEETKAMIDDESNEKLNERDVAAFFADKEREDDEKRVEKLYKDIANGGLRRKRGAERGDLWDSDDEDEAAARRRAAKQREFAKMRKALLADEKIGKIAENPKQQAFLKAIEDHEDEDDLAFLDQPENGPSQIGDSQGLDDSQRADPLRPTTGNEWRRNAVNESQDSIGDTARIQMPPPPLPRRSTKFTKPTSLADIRDTLSDLIGQPDSFFDMDALTASEHSASEAENDDEDAMDMSDDENTTRKPPVPHPNPRRTVADPIHTAVIDRMALKRGASSTVSNGDRLAFQSASKASEGSFRVPSLLRRVTSASDSGVSVTTGNTMALAGKGGVRMGGSKKSSVGYYGRGDERKAKIDRLEKERMEERLRVGKMRREGPGLRRLTGGSWE